MLKRVWGLVVSSLCAAALDMLVAKCYTFVQLGSADDEWTRTLDMKLRTQPSGKISAARGLKGQPDLWPRRTDATLVKHKMFTFHTCASCRFSPKMAQTESGRDAHPTKSNTFSRHRRCTAF